MKRKWKKGAALLMAAAMLGGLVNPFSQSADVKAYAAAGEASVGVDISEAGSMDEMQIQTQADTAQVYSANELQPDMEKNLNYQNYGVYAGMVSSNLAVVEGGYMRVQHVDGKNAPVVEYYDEQFQLKSQQYIKKELNNFAGFYAGKDYYYIAWVQNVPLTNWDKNKVFMRVTKYDKDWMVQDYEDINSADIKDIGVVYMCDSGSLRMTEHQGHLYINTCYVGTDTHQRSIVFDIIEEDMTYVKLEINRVQDYYGRTSHSFNQFLLIDEGLTPKRMVTLNQGDSKDNGQRGVALSQCVLYTEYPETVLPADKKFVIALEAAGGDYHAPDGNVNNNVGMSFGGLEQSQTSYIIAGNSVEQVEETFLKAEQRNIFVTATSRTNFTKDGTNVTWLTDYKEGDGVVISTPHLVKMNDNRFLVMWHVGAQEDHVAGILNYTFVDGNGNRCSGDLGQTRTVSAEISDCKPIVKDGKAVWYSSGLEGVYFYTIDTQGNFVKHGVNTMEEIPTLKKVEMQEDGLYFEWEPVEHASGYLIGRRYATGWLIEDDWKYIYTVCEVEGGQTCQYLDEKRRFLDDRSYDFFVCALDENGVPSYGSNMINQWIFRGLYDSQVALENDAEGVGVYWNTEPEVEFRIYRSSADTTTDEKLIATVKGPDKEDYTWGEVQSYIDTNVESGVLYDYSVSIYNEGHESARYNKHSIMYLSKPEVSAKCTVNKGRNTITLSWDEVKGAERYTVYKEVWNESLERYESINMGESFRDDKLSCVIYGALEGKKYRFRVCAKSKIIKTSSMQYSNIFNSAWSETELTYERPEELPPEAPSSIVYENTNDGMKLAWTPVEGVDGYEIAISDESQETRTVTWADAEYVDTDVTEGEIYTYKVRGYVLNGENNVYSDWSEKLKVEYKKPEQPPTVVLSTPSFTLVENTDGSVKLAWTPIEMADGYQIYIYDNLLGARIVTRTAAECEDKRIAEGLVRYKVRAYYIQKNGIWIYSDWSEAEYITYQKPATPETPGTTPGTTPETPPVIELQTPSFTSLENINEGVRLAWTPSEGAEGYEIQVANNSNARLRTVRVGVVEYAYVDASEGTTYTYKIRAYVQQDGVRTYSDWSAEESIKYQRPTPLSTPQITSIKNTENGVELTWDEVEGAQDYWVYCYDGPDSAQYSFFEKTSTTTYTDKKAEEGKTYYYVVYAGMSKDSQYHWSRASEREGIQYKNPRPAAPLLMNLTGTEEGVKVEWLPVEGAEGYYVYFYNSGNFGGVYSCRKIEGGSASSAIIGYSSMLEGKTYSYYVRAYNGEVESPMSRIIDIRTPGSSEPVVPDPGIVVPAPVLKSVECFKNMFGSGIEVTWEPVEGAEEYVIFSFENGESRTPQRVYAVNGTRCWFYDLTENAEYRFYIVANKRIDSMDVSSASSEEMSIVFITPSDTTDPDTPMPTPTPTPTPTPSDTLAAPENVEVKCVSNGVKITWEPVEGAEGYVVKCQAQNPQETRTWRLEGQDTVSFVQEYGTEGETYVYCVAAYTNNKMGKYSEEKSIVFRKPSGTTDPDDPNSNPDPDPDDPNPNPNPNPDPDDPNPNPAPVPSVMLGDVNGDGEITSKDALAILKDSVGIEQLVFIKEVADVNRDTNIDSKDALMILKHCVGILEIK